MSIGYASPGFGSSAELYEMEHAQRERVAAWRAEAAANAARYEAAVAAAKTGNGFCELAAAAPLPFGKSWMPVQLSEKSAEQSAYDLRVLRDRADAAAQLIAAGEDPAWCAAWAKDGYVGRKNMPGSTNRAYQEFNDLAERTHTAPQAQAAAPAEPEQSFTLADLASLCNNKRSKK